MSDDLQLEAVIAQTIAGAKYRAICPDLVRSVARRELHAHRTVKAAVKETRAKLHQITGAFFAQRPAYAAWLHELAAAPRDQQVLARLLGQHASTHERLPGLARWSALFATLPTPATVLDLGCGLNPLTLAWHPSLAAAQYQAHDIDAEMIGFLHAWFALAGVNGAAHVTDLSSSVPAAEPTKVALVPPSPPAPLPPAGEGSARADLVLAFKLLPTLDQVRKGAARDLLRSLDFGTLIISYPAQTLGGRSKGMVASYERDFAAHAADLGWTYTRHDMPGEVVFVVHTIS